MAVIDGKILLADDETDIADLMEEVLRQDGFQDIRKAYNGADAVNICREFQPDAVILDIVLPDIDGLEVCRQIREFSYCSILFLSSKNDDVDKILGLASGGDDYITKPFNMEVLKLRINKIIEMNVKRQEIFNQDIKIEPSRITITPLDQQLVEKAIQIVEDNISETEFSVEELASSLNISRSYFYKKMIKITGKKPIEFIRTIRMKRAQQLLTESQMQVSEIAYTLGYNSPKIFSKHFKEEFNISPSEFIRQQAE